MLWGHEGQENILELRSQWLEGQKASRRPPGTWGVAGLGRASSSCGTICSHSTCLSSGELLKEPDLVTPSLEPASGPSPRARKPGSHLR